MNAETDLEARCRLARECGSLAQQLASAKDHIARLENKRIRRTQSLHPVESHFGDLDCIVEVEIDEATGDGWNEPRFEASATPIYVWLGGVRFDADEFSADLQDRWADEAMNDLKQGAEA